MSQTESFEFWIYGNRTEVQIRQFFSEEYGGMVWPAAKTVGAILSANPERVRGKAVLELGCGTGLSGIVASKCGAHVLFTDKRDPPEILDNCKENCRLNGLTDYEVIPVQWGEPIPHLPSIDMIIGADLFYDSKLLDDLLFTVSYIMLHNPQCQLLFAFPYRESVQLLKQYFDRWRLSLLPPVLYEDEESETNVMVVSSFEWNESTQ